MGIGVETLEYVHIAMASGNMWHYRVSKSPLILRLFIYFFFFLGKTIEYHGRHLVPTEEPRHRDKNQRIL